MVHHVSAVLAAPAASAITQRSAPADLGAHRAPDYSLRGALPCILILVFLGLAYYVLHRLYTRQVAKDDAEDRAALALASSSSSLNSSSSSVTSSAYSSVTVEMEEDPFRADPIRVYAPVTKQETNITIIVTEPEPTPSSPCPSVSINMLTLPTRSDSLPRPSHARVRHLRASAAAVLEVRPSLPLPKVEGDSPLVPAVASPSAASPGPASTIISIGQVGYCPRLATTQVHSQSSRATIQVGIKPSPPALKVDTTPSPALAVASASVPAWAPIAAVTRLKQNQSSTTPRQGQLDLPVPVKRQTVYIQDPAVEMAAMDRRIQEDTLRRQAWYRPIHHQTHATKRAARRRAAWAGPKRGSPLAQGFITPVDLVEKPKRARRRDPFYLETDPYSLEPDSDSDSDSGSDCESDCDDSEPESDDTPFELVDRRKSDDSLRSSTSSTSSASPPVSPIFDAATLPAPNPFALPTRSLLAQARAAAAAQARKATRARHSARGLALDLAEYGVKWRACWFEAQERKRAERREARRVAWEAQAREEQRRKDEARRVRAEAWARVEVDRMVADGRLGYY